MASATAGDSPRQAALALRARLLDRVRRLLVEDLSVRLVEGAIDPDAPLFNVGVGLDSVDAIELAFAVEKAFGVSLPEGDAFAEATRSVNRVVDHLLERGASA